VLAQSRGNFLLLGKICVDSATNVMNFFMLKFHDTPNSKLPQAFLEC
jgi:hypothetical protein